MIVCSSALLIKNPQHAHTLCHACCSVSKVDFDVVVFTNTQPDAIAVEDKKAVSEFWEFESEADMVEAHAPIFEMLTEPQRQRAVVNLDGTLLCTTCLKAWLMPQLTNVSHAFVLHPETYTFAEILRPKMHMHVSASS